MERISELPTEPNVINSMSGSNQQGMQILGLTDPAADPKDIVEAIDTFVYDRQKGTRPLDKSIDPEDLPYALGSLWAEQLIRQFQWQWVKVQFLDHNNSVAYGVASKDRSMIIYPIHFLMGCLRDPEVDATILLSFNMLVASSMGSLKARSYENVMECVHRIVPRD